MEGVRRILGVPETFLSLSLFSLPSCISPPVLCLSPSFACSFSRSILLISWLKMSDTRTDRPVVCASPQDCNAPIPARKEQVCEKKKKKEWRGMDDAKDGDRYRV